MSDSAIPWLQSIETILQRAIADVTIEYETASLKDRPKVYMVLAKLRERRNTVNNAIIDILQERIQIRPPSADTVSRTKALTDALQLLVFTIEKYDAVLKLLSDLSVLITKTIMEPAHV
ncbi:hypothetical protein RBA41_03935 [Massilia sp. CCM 9210]|uniref:hypothetical protein n=1 Tax=Massilia scottii TaxID=3057166 RepID=UPI00279661E1|nr:hypothetical protein [Massilia sp. CCM 9210]MDQ1812447.1 hypothetical protein [Massilia sp. CCM 9210]